MSSESLTIKRRIHQRYAINLAGEILTESSAVSIPCLIVDFCVSGLYLNTRYYSNSVPQLQDKSIKVGFTLGRDDAESDFVLHAKVVRLDADGLGVAVDHMPPSVFNALKLSATQIHSLQGNLSDRRKAVAPVRSHANLEKALEKLFYQQLPLIFRDFFKAAVTELELIIANTHNDDERRQLTELSEAIRGQGKEIFKSFFQAVVAEIASIHDPKDRPKAQMEKHSGKLSLVDTEDFEDWLNISSVVRNLNAHFGTELTQLEQKLRIVLAATTEQIHNPLIPEVFCFNLQQALLNFPLTNVVRRSFYKIYGEILLNSLGDLYLKANRILVELGAPEEIPVAVAKPAGVAKSVDADRYNAVEQKPDSSTPRPTQSESAPRPQIPPVASVVPPQPLQAAEAYPAAEIKGRKPIGQTLGNVFQLLKEVDVNAQQSGIGSGSGTSTSGQIGPVYTVEELAGVLNQLQDTKRNISEIHRDSSSLSKQLLTTLENSEVGVKQLSSGDADKLELYGRFFDTVFNDLRFSTDIKAHLESMHLALITLAMQGVEFLNSDDHPITNIINQIAFLESTAKGNKVVYNERIKKALEDIVSRISREATLNHDVLVTAEKELNAISAPVTRAIETNIARVIAVYDNRQKLEKVRYSVQKDLDDRLLGKMIPNIVKFLLESGWQDLIVLAELNGKQNGVSKHDLLNVIDELLTWYEQREPFSSDQLALIGKTLKLIDAQLTAACVNAFYDQRPIVAELVATLVGVGKPPLRRPVEMVAYTSAVQVPPDLDELWLALSEDWQVGDWFLLTREGEEPDPLKLVWVGETLDLLVFVNRDGFKKLEMSREEMTDHLRIGSLMKTESFDAPLMERATNMMLQKLHSKLIYHAAHDPITDLLNKKELVRVLNLEKPRFSDSVNMLCQVDLLNFRTIDSLCGMAGSEKLLRKMSALISRQLRGEDVLARIGDYSFAILLKNCSSDEGNDVARRIVSHIEGYSFKWEENSYAIALGIGLVEIDGGCNVERLLQNANSASLLAKEKGNNTVQMYREDDESLRLQADIMQWAGRIDQVLADERLFIRCQKIEPMNREKGEHSHYEILLGVWDQNNNLLAPDNFIPAVERWRRMPEIDRWIVGKVFDWIEANPETFQKIGGFAINLSGQSLNSDKFLDFLLKRLKSISIQHEKITFEVTETAAVANIAFTRKFIKLIKRFGCKFSLDDFGSGYSSYSYLKDLELDYIKIDGVFVKDITHNPKDVAIVKSINEIGHSLGLQTIAEYVENDMIYDILENIGVDYVQGWCIQKPFVIEELTA